MKMTPLNHESSSTTREIFVSPLPPKEGYQVIIFKGFIMDETPGAEIVHQTRSIYVKKSTLNKFPFFQVSSKFGNPEEQILQADNDITVPQVSKFSFLKTFLYSSQPRFFLMLIFQLISFIF